jgi:hypothetical protein
MIEGNKKKCLICDIALTGNRLSTCQEHKEEVYLANRISNVFVNKKEIYRKHREYYRKNKAKLQQEANKYYWEVRRERDGVKRTKIKPILQSAYKMSPELAYVLGVMLGDGTKTKHHIFLNVIDKDFALNFKEKLENWSGIKAKIHEREPKGNRKRLYCLYFSSIKAIAILNSLIRQRKDIRIFMKFPRIDILKLPYKCQIAFLEGLYDSEGYVSISNYNIEFVNKNKQLIFLIKRVLKKLRIISSKSYISQTGISSFKIHQKENILKFHKHIHFSIKRKQENLNLLVNIYRDATHKKVLFKREDL